MEEKSEDYDFHSAGYRRAIHKSDSCLENNKPNWEISKQACRRSCCWDFWRSLLWLVCLQGMLGFDWVRSQWAPTKVHFNAILQSWLLKIHYFQKNHLAKKWRWNCFDSQDVELRSRVKRSFLEKANRSSRSCKLTRGLAKPTAKWR